MKREQVEFIQAQKMPWQKDNRFIDFDVKILSVDEESGSYTALQKIPEGYFLPGVHALAANEEFYVLSGLVHLNGIEYTPGCYCFLPAGHERKNLSAVKETVILRLFEGAPDIYTGQESADGLAEGRPAILCLDAYRMQWDQSVHDARLAHLGFGRKNLRVDPITGQRTFLFMTSPQTYPSNWRGKLESHPTPEEAYMLSGDLTGHVGTMTAGAYFWRPIGVTHGPFGSIGGSLFLIRFVGGKHVNIWSEEEHHFSFQQPYKPVLPKRLQPFAGAYKVADSF